jgi:hypothetical protein
LVPRKTSISSVKLTAVALIAVRLVLWPGTGAADPAEDGPDVVKPDPNYAVGKQAIDVKDWPVVHVAQR